MRVLVIEDSEKLRRAIEFALRKAGYAVDLSDDGEEGLWFAQNNDYDAVILDLLLPKVDGMEVLQRIRESGHQIPILILTVKGTLEDRVGGLRAGADDYLTKPFDMEELLARIEALVRRKYGSRQPVLTLGSIEMDTNARRVRRAGRIIHLTPREYKVLELLAQRCGEVISQTEIEAHLYDEDAEIMSNVIEAIVSTLRKKLDIAGRPSLIRTPRGMGYVMVPDE